MLDYVFHCSEKKSMANRGKPPTDEIPSRLGQILTDVQSKPIYPSLKTAEYWGQYSEQQQDNIYRNAKNILPAGVWAIDTETGTTYTEEQQQQIIAELSKQWFVGVHETLSLDKLCQMFFDFWQYDERVEPGKFKFAFLKHRLYGNTNGIKNIKPEVLYFIAPFTPYSVNELIAIANDDKIKLSSQRSTPTRSTNPYRPNFGTNNNQSSQYQHLDNNNQQPKTPIVLPWTQIADNDNTVTQANVNKGNTMLADDHELIKIIQNKLIEEGGTIFLNAGISREELSAIINGNEPKLSSGYRLAEALGIPLETILELASRTWNNNN
jgi:hypothetical protein